MASLSPELNDYKIAARLKAARLRQADTSQRKLAERLQRTILPDFTPARWSRLELGYADATWAEVQALAKLLEVKPDWLAGHEARSFFAEPEAPVRLAPKGAARIVAEPVRPAPQPLGAAVAASSAQAAAAQAPVASPHPVPPDQVPDRQGRTEAAYQGVLAAEMARAEQMLHIPRLPAPDWARWRAYQKSIKQVLQALTNDVPA